MHSGGADALSGEVSVLPVAAARDQKATLVLETLAILLDRTGVFFIPNISDPLEKEQRQDVALSDTLYKWRTERDSNPRIHCCITRFPSVRIRPLCHLSD